MNSVVGIFLAVSSVRSELTHLLDPRGHEPGGTRGYGYLKYRTVRAESLRVDFFQLRLCGVGLPLVEDQECVRVTAAANTIRKGEQCGIELFSQLPAGTGERHGDVDGFAFAIR